MGGVRWQEMSARSFETLGQAKKAGMHRAVETQHSINKTTPQHVTGLKSR